MKTTVQLLVSLVGIAVAALLLAISLRSCSNSPYPPGEAAKAIYFTSFSTPPKKLDPATAYFSYEGNIIDKICEPPFTYHYLKRPYELMPRTAVAVPEPVYFDADGNPLGGDAPAGRVARAEYTVRLQPGIRYQDHPCFARGPDGAPLYRNLSPKDLEGIESPNDFPVRATRELVARDYELQVRRLADPRLSCPIYPVLANTILGMADLHDRYAAMLEEERARRREAGGAGFNREMDEDRHPIPLDYFAPEFPGFQVLDPHTFKLVLRRKYPQMLYWMAMHFFCAMPEEAVRFYEQPALVEKQIVLNRWPVGSGAYYLRTLVPNDLIALERNPNFRDMRYPAEGAPGDAEAGLLADAGRKVPFIDRLEMHIEKEAIPRWTKFLQGYYDASGVMAEVFDQTIQLSSAGDPNLSADMAARGITLTTSVAASTYYMAFNLLDPVVGGYGEAQRKLRQAISIAIDYNEYLAIFLNGRGIAAQGPIPPGIFGSEAGEAGVNPYVDRWDPRAKKAVRRPIAYARQLLEEAGYAGGRNAEGRPLVVHLDHAAGGDQSFDPEFQWLKRRFALLGIELRERGTDLSRFRDKTETGNWQILRIGWLADYPDPENFLFLFYGPNGKVQHEGENKSNYENAEFDRLFKQMETMPNTPERKAIIDRMVDLLRRDAPWVWGYHPVGYSLQHAWVKNAKDHQMAYDTLKYLRIDADRRAARQAEWNRPRVAPVVTAFVLVALALVPGAVLVRARRARQGDAC